MGDSEDNGAALIETKVREALKGVGCCDFRFSVGQLGLVHDVAVSHEGNVAVKVLPCCIFGMTRLVTSVKGSLVGLEGVTDVEVEVAWDQIGKRDLIPKADRQVLQLDLETLARDHGLKGWGSASDGG